tara:strand:- start:984 stop:2042 length:1059 start_codon:yes stop_codon:yes gene_type:complete
MSDPDRKIIRSGRLAQNIIIIDGFPGCGKTLFGPIISSLDRVELLSYAFEIEFICRLNKLSKIEDDAAISLIKMLVDHKLYQTMMGRDTNFRYSDLSSVFNDSSPLRYFKRIFQKGDDFVPERIKEENPILSLTTHDLLAYSDPLVKGLEERLTFIEILRHPLYMIIQETVNMETLYDKINPRDIQIYFDYRGQQMPYFTAGWEEKFLQSNNVDRAIYTMHYCHEKTSVAKSSFQNSKSNLISIPFEKFVIDPYIYLNSIASTANTKIINKTYKSLKKQNVPRSKVSDGIPLEVYKRFGWVPPEKGLSEQGELIKRRDWAIESGASDECLELLDNLSREYEVKYLNAELESS